MTSQQDAWRALMEAFVHQATAPDPRALQVLDQLTSHFVDLPRHADEEYRRVAEVARGLRQRALQGEWSVD